MTERYYYIRDDITTSPNGKGRPIITFCLIKDGTGNIGRGIAICSDQDQPCKKVGRGIAKTRALYALSSAKNGCKVFGGSFYKAAYNPKVTEFELKLLGYSEDQIDEAKEMLRIMTGGKDENSLNNNLSDSANGICITDNR